MSKRETSNAQGFDFSKNNKVSIWASQTPYADIPEAYFEERFSRNQTRANNLWSDNFKLRFFYPENMETNGSESGLVDIEKAAGECSFSESYIQNLMGKAKRLELLQVSWVVLLFDNEYSAKTSEVSADDYLQFIGSFSYNELTDSVYEIDSDEDENEFEDEGQLEDDNLLESKN